MSAGGDGRTAVDAVGDAMRAIPGPTEAWADIVGHLAWPLTVLVLVLRFREELARAAGLLAERFRTDDVQAFGFSMKRSEQVVELAPSPEGADDDSGHRSDAATTEKLLELAGDDEGYIELNYWIADNVPGGVVLDDFLSEGAYVQQRRDAVRALTKEGQHG